MTGYFPADSRDAEPEVDAALNEVDLDVNTNDDILLAIYVQLSRIYDVLLVANSDNILVRKLAKEHEQGMLIAPEPVMAGETDMDDLATGGWISPPAEPRQPYFPPPAPAAPPERV